MRDARRWQDAFDALGAAVKLNAEDTDLLYEQAMMAEKLDRVDALAGEGVIGGEAPTARLLDRNGKPMGAVPVTATLRQDADGSRWQVAQVPLFPLGPGDYIVEVAAGNVKTLTPFRVVP